MSTPGSQSRPDPSVQFSTRGRHCSLQPHTTGCALFDTASAHALWVNKQEAFSWKTVHSFDSLVQSSSRLMARSQLQGAGTPSAPLCGREQKQLRITVLKRLDFFFSISQCLFNFSFFYFPCLPSPRFLLVSFTHGFCLLLAFSFSLLN